MINVINYGFIEPWFNCEPCLDYVLYCSLLTKFVNNDISIKDLEIQISSCETLKLQQELIFKYPEGSIDKIGGSRNFKTNNDIIYLDQNIISEFRRDRDFSDFVLSIKEKPFQFVYSPSHIEEVFKIEEENKRDVFLKAIRKITDDALIVRSDSGYILAKEDPIFSLDRIKSFDGTTQIVENIKVISIQDRSRFLEKYNSDKHRKVIGGKESIFMDLSDKDFSELMKFSHTYTYKEKKDFKNVKKSTDRMHAIYTLSYALDLLAYKIDKSLRTKKSSVHDIEHLIYASHANFFVTKDKNFLLRAKQIYSFLELDVAVYSQPDFISKFT